MADGVAGTRAASAERHFARIVAALAGDARVSLGAGRGFGRGALKTGGRIFAMVTPAGAFVVKLPRARVDALAAGGIGESFDPGRGRRMKEWLAVNPAAADWLALAAEALEFVSAGGAAGR